MSKTNGLTWYDAEQYRHNLLAKRQLADPCAVRKSLATATEFPDDPARTIRFVISSSSEDRDKDVVAVGGWKLDNYLKNPVVMWAHDYRALPVAKCLSIAPRGDKLVAEAQFPSPDLYPFADTVFRMLKGGYLGATSVGFRPLKAEPNAKRGGVDFHEQELLEFSVVPIPSNQEALVEARAAGIDLLPIKDWAEGVLAGWHGHDGVWVKKGEVERLRGWAADLVAKPMPIPDGDEEQDHFISRCMGNPTMNEDYSENDQRAAVCHSQWRRHQAESSAPVIKIHDARERWNLSLSKAFDIQAEPVEPSSPIFGWISRYLGVPIAQVYQTRTAVPHAKVGSFFSALDNILSVWDLDALRNFTDGGKEKTPLYEDVRLNSKMSATFLIEGTRFLRSKVGVAKIVLAVDPNWNGLILTGYSATAHKTTLHDFFRTTQERAAEINYLKGEQFSLSGEFLERDGTSWEDVFLPESTRACLTRAVKGMSAQSSNRGLLFMGPPGTGKTLSGRAMMNESDATFIWVAARDFYYSGSFGGITHAFDLARECAPTILFIEDVDNWLYDTTVDLIKTEMDGLRRSSGVVTILTTNHPETFPKALIDRPGRFDDVLLFDLPDEQTRMAMLKRWLPSCSIARRVAKETSGYSGAHMRELATFADKIRAERDCTLDTAVEAAVAKVREQREVIAEAQRRKATFVRPAWLYQAAWKQAKPYGDCPKGKDCPMQADMAQCPEGKDCPLGKGLSSGNGHVTDKRGRVLSSRNEERLRQALTSLNDILGELQKPDEAEAAPARGPAGEEIILELTETCTEAVLELTDGKPDGYAVDEDELRAALAAVLREAIQTEVQSAIAAARGRIT